MARIHQYWVYILSNDAHSVFYIGVTNDLYRRILEHRAMEDEEAFTGRYRVLKLVYYQRYQWINEAIAREKKLKKWKREWKVALINELNPGWKDLLSEFEI